MSLPRSAGLISPEVAEAALMDPSGPLVVLTVEANRLVVVAVAEAAVIATPTPADQAGLELEAAALPEPLLERPRTR
jgi:hypothetical protein